MTKNKEIVLAILKDEVEGNIDSALLKMAPGYSMTWMYKSRNELFPRSKENTDEEMKEIYHIKGRKYEIKNIAESENVVMVELIESYPDPNNGKWYQTPLVLVLEMEDGKIKTGRHYCDPRVSYEDISQEVLEKAYHNAPTQITIQ